MEASERFISRGKTGTQMRAVRRDGWTARKREIFLDHYATHGNAAAACAAAGMGEGAAYRLRRRDPDFARQYDEAHAVAMLRLEEMMLLHARTGGRTTPVEAGAPDMALFDPELALKILSRPRPSVNGSASRVGARPRSADREELIATVVKLLGALRRREAKRLAA